MGQDMQLGSSEKHVQGPARTAFRLLQIPEPDPFSLWM